MAFPSTLSSFSRPSATDRLNSPSHSALHNTVSSALGQVEAVIGVDGISSVVGTMMYDLRSPASSGGGHVQTAVKGGTGQTNFAKGDILVASSTSVLSKLSVGTNGYLVTANSGAATGIQWSSATSVLTANISTPIVRVYTTSSVAGWTKPSLLSYIVVEGVGGGGGGGAAGAATGAGGGGAGGGYSRRKVLPSVLSVSENIIVGGAGTGGVNGGAAATVGGTTIFGVSSVILATGGSAGTVGSAGAAAQGVDGGIGSNGDVNISGGGSGAGIALAANYIGGMGGSSYFGGGARSNGSGGTGIDGRVYGAGGSGGSVNNNGGAGSAGVIVITEYYI